MVTSLVNKGSAVSHRALALLDGMPPFEVRRSFYWQPAALAQAGLIHITAELDAADALTVYPGPGCRVTTTLYF
jgi:hypothetical protein